MTDKHTPGPWRYKKYKLGSKNNFFWAGWSIHTSPRGRERLEHGIAWHVDDLSAEGEANASLIAAAPDLLAALEDADEFPIPLKCRQIIRAAIAKAKQ